MECWKGERRRQETEDSMQNWNSGIMEGWENKIQKTAKEKPFSHRVTEKTQRKNHLLYKIENLFFLCGSSELRRAGVRPAFANPVLFLF